MKTVVLLSGGLDSVTALYQTHRDATVVLALSFNYGAKHHARELPMAALHANRLGVPHGIVPLDFIGERFQSALLERGGVIPKGHYEAESMRQTVVPYRNGILLSIAAGFAENMGANAIVIAAHAGDHAICPDCREEFMSAMGDAIRSGTYARIELQRPFIGMNKAEIAARAVALGVNVLETWSCYIGGEIHCGECGTCVERREAFAMAGIADPTPYQSESPLPVKPGL